MAKVYDGKEWFPVNGDGVASGSTVPVPPKTDGDGTIFVSIPSFRDGKRCAQTLKSLFENAQDPSKVIVGLIEQNAPEDDFCIEEYCAFYNIPKFLKKQAIRADTTKVMLMPKAQERRCPYYNQIRLVAVHNIAAKGPGDARVLARKVLGNEDYCMQIDAHTLFTKHWDAAVKEEWRATQNEFAVISTVPADVKDQSSTEVPRQCLVRYDGSDIPGYESPADGKAVGLTKPLLSHAWSAAFSFAKCHLEESAPYDSFAPYVLGAEQFPRFARFWTRGYDVYTPTRNIVFHDYQQMQHGQNEWMKRRQERLRKESLDRFRSFLGIGGNDVDKSERAQANLGIYGLGKRRSLQQMMDFIGIDLVQQRGNRLNTKCADHTWMPYDSSISPVANLHSNADDLDPQPEYPQRTRMVYYQQEKQTIHDIELLDNKDEQHEAAVPNDEPATGMASTGAPLNALFVLWILGLMVWCSFFMSPSGSKQRFNKRRKGLSGKDV